MTEKLTKELYLSKKMISDIAQLLDGKIKCKNQKEILHISYFDIFIEHMDSILLLVSNGHIGSSLALIRTFYETFYRGQWVLAFANDSDIENILNGKHSFSKINILVSELDKFYTKEDFFKFQIEYWWASWCGYAHTDITPLSRRWTDDKLIPNYTDDEIIEILKDLRQMLKIFAYVIAKKYHLTRELEAINEWY